ncbi:MAG: response regulator transcription factor [Lachnospirales bacterium]
MKATILVVDDDKEIVNAICKLLELNDYITLKAYNGIEAIEIATNNDIDLIILDVMMPKLDGMSALKKIRVNCNIPVIILSAKTEDYDKILGLKVGADDYITKPYSPQILVAKVEATIRRFMFLGSKDSEDLDTENLYQTGNLILDTKSKEAIVDGQSISLTPKEYGILLLLMSNLGVVFSVEEIYSNVWNEDAYDVNNTVMVHIRRLRKKIEIDSKNAKYLKVVWGIGYKVEKY